MPSKKGKTKPKSRAEIVKLHTTTNAAGATVSRELKVNADSVVSQFIEDARRLLLKELPDDVRSTFSRENGFTLTPDLLRVASTWKKLRERCCDLGKQLVDLAIGFLRVSEHEEWIDAQLDWSELGLLQVVDTIRNREPGARAVVDLACTILYGRWQIGTDASRKVIVEKISEAVKQGKICASLALAKLLGPRHAREEIREKTPVQQPMPPVGQAVSRAPGASQMAIQQQELTKVEEADLQRKLENPKAFPTVSVKEVAVIFGKSPSTIYRWVEEGKLRSSKVPGRILTESVKRLLAVREELPE